jgi:hypothetical protein
MPGFQAVRRICKGVEKRVGVQEVAIVSGGPVEVLPGQSEAEVTGK